MKSLKLLLFLTIFIFTSCNKKDLIEKQITTMPSELGTVEYTISKIIKVDDNSFYTIGDRKILFTCKAIVKAGIDLKEFDKDDVKYNVLTDSIKVVLPKPTILSFNMPAQDIKLEYMKVGSLRKDFDTEERNNFLQQGEEDIKANIESMGIIDDAKKNAQLFFEALFRNMDVKGVKIEFN